MAENRILPLGFIDRTTEDGAVIIAHQAQRLRYPQARKRRWPCEAGAGENPRQPHG